MDGIAGKAASVRTISPVRLFWMVGVIVYGGAALNFAHGHFLDQASRDIWQHLAALRALMENPVDPLNPFLPGGGGSRHFHPQWVSLAFLARALGWDAWQAIAFAGGVNALLLLVGIQIFARAFYRSDWGPIALLGAMVLGWSLPSSHTGYHSMGTLIEGIAYPAVLLIALSFILWGAIIRALEDRVSPAWLCPLAALMMATHQLGAGIGFIVAGCLILCWPEGRFRRRVEISGALLLGLALSAAWPYHSPFTAIVQAGNPTWTGGIDYYSIQQIWIATVPAGLGVIGLVGSGLAGRGRPILLALAVFVALFLVGLWDVPIATRFIMPAVLMLHIGLGALFLRLARRWGSLPKAAQLSMFAFALVCLGLYGSTTAWYLLREQEQYARAGDAFSTMLPLTADIPDQEPVAAYDVAAWLLVASGQRVASVPWPEPLIADLPARQAAIEQLFDADLPPAERLALARRLGVRVLVIDARGPLRRPLDPRLLPALAAQAVAARQSGPFRRYDLY